MAQADADHEELLTIRDHINYLRRWIHQRQSILYSLDTDEFLLRFLRITDFRLEKTKERLISFWRYRTENPQWFRNRDLTKNQLMCQISELAYCLQLPKATKDKHLIFLMRLGQYDPLIYTIDDVTRYAFAVADILNIQPAAQLYGFIAILDFTNIRLQHIRQFTPDRIRRYVDCWEKMYPVHLRQIHFYNYPRIFGPILHLFRFFYCRNLDDRICFHSRTSNDSMKKSLHKYIDPALLPNEYGGELDSVESDMHESFIQWTHQHNDYLIKLEQCGVDLKELSLLSTKNHKS
ncbi:unnamed protein product [Rotaria magnacalcarata]|uniref:CRAL-TRIO domain-containing protein n=1 Tax=Rotaria magnacalcarata TaxID=392030 RepID=A0A818VZM2_9BILA|nr:unnamed protein product [Rotaria magnacalcarata]CAF1919312.1 unnamed protein product [Rotaria magnacalcarata]CAF2054631.1 unnamed protein product [Rotaria magnacalcarata]CAF2062254.1 unnamed protein product [Rotaria magnacalcarata]CAF3718069.1 unnamed protein product [Rotaria magnacalcarata]